MDPVHFLQNAVDTFRRRLRQLLLILGGLLVMGSSHALPAGFRSTIFNGPLPADATYLCREGNICSISGIKEVWYGGRQTWGYRLASGAVVCNNDEFTDVLPGVGKHCYIREPATPTVLPPKLKSIAAMFVLNDLLTVENGRYKVDVMFNGKRLSLTQPRELRELTAFAAGSAAAISTQSVFQFNITDTANPIQEYAVMVTTTQDRCVMHSRTGGPSTEVAIGRVVEVYTMTARPEAQIVPFRSDVEQVCTNDNGVLAFHIAPPNDFALQVRIVSYDSKSVSTGLHDLVIPTNSNWLNL